MTINSEIQTILAGRGYVYKLFQSIFGTEPTKEQLEVLKEEVSLSALDLFSFGEADTYNEAYEAFVSALNASLAAENGLENLRREYTFLLIGPNKLPAPPWESVYRTKERLLFQESTLDVRKTYVAEGVIPAEYPHVADDHIALELDFMATLANRAGDAYEEGKGEEAKRLLAVSESFLTEHLMFWIPLFVADLPGEGFYVTAARLLAAFLSQDKAAIGELSTAL